MKEHAIRMTTRPKDRFWTTVNLESNMNKTRNSAFFAIAATACTLSVPAVTVAATDAASLAAK
jgi:hypothetical protein